MNATESKTANAEKYLNYAKWITAFVSAFVSHAVGSHFIDNNAPQKTAFMGVFIGLVIGIMFFLAQGRTLEVCFRRTYSNAMRSLLLIYATVLATMTSYFTFEKIYHAISPRLFEAQNAMRAGDSYLSGAVTGALIQALVMAIFINYLPVVLAIFGWISASRKHSEAE